VDAVAVSTDDRLHEIAIVLEAVRRCKCPSLVPLGAAPSRRVAQTGDDLQVVLLGEVHNLIVFLPGRAIGIVATVLEVAFAVDFDVFPGELLPDPVKAGVGDHLHGALPLLRFDFLLQEGVYPVGILPGVGHRYPVGCIGRGPCEVSQPLQSTPGLTGE
jgi:hypothetical protein